MKKTAFTVRELQVLKEALEVADSSQKDLLGKIWKMQSEIINADIKAIRKEQARKLAEYRKAREIRQAI